MAAVVPPVAILLAVAVVLPLLGRFAGHVVAALATWGVLLWILLVPAGIHHEATFVTFDVVLVHVDPASRLMGAIFAFMGAVMVLYAYSSDRPIHQTAIGVAYAAAGLGVVFAGDWLSLLVFVEIMSVTSLLLIWSSGGPAVRAGFRYAIFHGISGILLLLAVALHYHTVGSFLFTAHHGLVGGTPALLGAIGIGINAGFVALHTWLPDAYPRCHFVVSVTLCAYTTKAAVYTLFRAFPDGHLFLAYMGGAMALVGVTMAVLQRDMRRLLTYHIQSQVGYMVAGIGIGSALGIAGGFLHLFNNILYKSLLFMVAGVIIYRTGKEDLKKLGGLGAAMPVTFVVFVIAALAIVGVPGFNGFVSKAMVKTAAEKAHLTSLKWLFTLVGIGTAMSFVKFGYYAFIRQPTGPEDRSRPVDLADASAGQAIVMGGIAFLCVLYGMAPGAIYELLPGIQGAAPQPFAFRKLAEAIILTVAGGVAFYGLRGPLSRVTRVPDIDAVFNPMAFYGLRCVVSLAAQTAGTIDGIGSQTVTTATAAVSGNYRLSNRIAGQLPIDQRTTKADLTRSLAVTILLVAALFFIL